MTSRPSRADIAPTGRAEAWTTPPEPRVGAIPGTPALSRLGHELRGPLAGIVGLSRLLVTKVNAGAVDAPSLVRHLGLIENSARRSLSTIEQVIEVAKISTGEIRADARAVDARRTVTDVVGSLRTPATSRGHRLDVDLPEHAVVLTTDHNLLGRLLGELVTNAVRFTDSDDIRVRLRAETGGPVAIDVTDDGPGIPAADQDRVFAPFERGGRPAHPDDEGAGLGLYLARTLADLLGARLTVQSQVGAGSTFTVAFAGPGGVAESGAHPRR